MILIVGVTTGLTVIVIEFEVAVAVVTQAAFEVNVQVITSLLFNVELLYVEVVAPLIGEPFTFH